MSEQEKPVLNAIQQAAEDMAAFATDHDARMTQGGRLQAGEDLPADSAPPAADDQPKQAAGPTPDENATDDQWDVLKDAVPGKWSSKEEAEKSYFNIVKLAREAQRERDALKAQVQATTAVQREMPAQRAEQRDALKALEDYGVPSDVLGEAIQSVAQRTIEGFLTPLAQQAQAQQYMQRKYGDTYAKNQPEIELFLSSDPETKALVEAAKAKGEFALAEEYALLRYQAERGARAEVAIRANQEVRKQVLDEARKDAGIVAPKRSDGRDKPKDEDMTAERFEKLVDKAKAGYPNQLWRETIGNRLPSELFD